MVLTLNSFRAISKGEMGAGAPRQIRAQFEEPCKIFLRYKRRNHRVDSVCAESAPQLSRGVGESRKGTLPFWAAQKGSQRCREDASSLKNRWVRWEFRCLPFSKLLSLCSRLVSAVLMVFHDTGFHRNSHFWYEVKCPD